MPSRIILAIVISGAGLGAQTLAADEAEIVASLEAFFATEDQALRDRIVRSIEADEAFDRNRLSEWLHELDRFEPLAPGTRTVEVPIDHGRVREVHLRVPQGYDPSRRWPLVYALHGTGGSASSILRYARSMLGDRVDEFIIASPHEYGQVAMGAQEPPSAEHLIVLRALKSLVHVESDRVYVTGYSKGGYTTWTLATLHPDQFAGAIPIACTYTVLPYVDGLWETMLPNTRHLPVLHCWGDRDDNPVVTIGDEAGDSVIHKLNDRFTALTSRDEFTNITHFMQPNTGHGGVRVPLDDLDDILDATRVRHPESFRHHFRFIHQSSTYWLEGLKWSGPKWGHQGMRFQPRPGEELGQTFGRVIHSRLGALHGSIEGQRIEIKSDHVSQLVLWFGEGMIDWDQPIQVIRDGRKSFAGRVKPDLGVALIQAVRTGDFDKLRWAGLRMRATGPASPVTLKTRFAPLMNDQ